MNIYRFIPRRIKDSIKVLVGRATAVPVQRNLSERRECPVCQKSIRGFNRIPDSYTKKQDEFGYIHPIYLIETINRLEYSCPNCGASDRDRLYALYLSSIYVPPNVTFSVLDIAPSKSLQAFFKKLFPKASYRSADLMMKDVDDNVDITNMTLYDNEQFDFFICSHVLEHVEDDRKAISELFRILKKGGLGILMVPILLSLKEDYENSEATSSDDRWKHFGQHDHVRMYSKNGFLSKLSEGGFIVKEYDQTNFGLDVFYRYGIHERSVLYIVSK